MHKIQTKIKNININIPKLIDLYCDKYSIILLQFIDGIPLSQLNQITTSQANNLLSQLKIIITEIGQIGVGHFDINLDNIVFKNELLSI